MAVHACLSVLMPGGRLIAYGGNDEGIRSFTGLLGRLCGEVETLATRGHGRVIASRRPADTSALRASLTVWRSVRPLEIGGVTHDWITYPGIFAADRIDEGTALLIGALPPLPPSAKVLDYGCGSGVIAASARAHAPDIALELLDSDAVALEAARENVTGARLVLGSKLADAGTARYDAVLSNPPLHHGFVEDHVLLEQLIADAPKHLEVGGVLQVVVQRRIPLDRLFDQTLCARIGRRGEQPLPRVASVRPPSPGAVSRAKVKVMGVERPLPNHPSVAARSERCRWTSADPSSRGGRAGPCAARHRPVPALVLLLVIAVVLLVLTLALLGLGLGGDVLEGELALVAFARD